MLTNETFLLESAHHTSSKLISKAPKCTIESFQLLLGAIDYINDNGGQESFPKLLIYDDTITHTTTITEEHSNSNSIEEDYVPPSLTISDESEDKSSEEDSPSTPVRTITTPKSKSSNSNSNTKQSNNGKPRGGHYNRNGMDDSNLICSCCKRDSSAVSFLKNYSIHAGNIDNYRSCFPDYDVVPGISCMTCYHKSWRYSKGLYDPNKARGTVNKREGIQKSPSPSTTTTSSTRKKASTQKRKSTTEATVEQIDSDVISSEDVKSKPRKISKRRQNSSPSSNQSANDTNSSNQTELEFENNQINENQAFTTSTYENSQGLHHSLRLVLKFVWIEQGDDGEVYSCPMNLDFVPTTLTSIKSLVIGKLKTKLSGYECDSIVWCHDNQKTLLTDAELQQKALRNDDTLIVNVK